VRVALETEFAGQATALLPDKLFYAGPVAPGERATLVWSRKTSTLCRTLEPDRRSLGGGDNAFERLAVPEDQHQDGGQERKNATAGRRR